MAGSITRAGLVFIVYLFIMTILFYTLATPVNTILVGVMNIDVPSVSDELNLYIPYYIQAITMVFLLGIATPCVWFIFWIFSREPIQGVVRR